jgi:AhpD family alkylhydroperoxidase
MDEREAWIRLIGRDEAAGRLRATYDRIAGADGQVDRVLQLHGLRPHTLDAHLALYKATLHHPGNRLPRWFLELIGVAVSDWNGCAYCVAHHRAGLERIVGPAVAAGLVDAAASAAPAAEGAVLAAGEALAGGERLAVVLQAALSYARALTLTPAGMRADDVEDLRAAGLDDGEVLEINQVVGYFNYVNRAVLGLGVSHVGERLGLAPSNASDETDVFHR